MDDSFIYLKDNSIPKDLCSEIIYLFENEMPLSNDKYVITGWFYTDNKYLF